MMTVPTASTTAGARHRWRVMPALSLYLTLAALALPCAAQELGRLFFTPQQRENLDRKRATNMQAPVPAAVEDRITVSGQVTRSSGPGTSWINGQPRDMTGPAPDPTRVAIPQGQGEPSVSLKVGQTLDRTKGETRDVLQDGSIAVPGNRRRSQ